eukprot:TRINITY_DN8959_c0_g1_i2.p1 TRINITY_DN8959_c0_g1~~TRINITY_DN8959_c0_g1_i2.p1  ORF type:complete len:233 (-),score=67.68 TRINITY_DN8959_c0_g1_i2:465-1163(-)
MGNRVSGKMLVITTGVLVSATLAFKAIKYYKSKNILAQFEKEIKNVGEINVESSKPIGFYAFLQIAQIIDKYSNEIKRLNWQANKLERQSLLKAREFARYTYSLIKAYEIQQESKQYIQNIVLDKLNIPEHIYERSVEAYKDKEGYVSIIEEDDEIEEIKEEEAKEMAKELERLKQEVDIDFYVPEELRDDCAAAMQNNWSSIIRDYIVDDRFYGQYGISAKQLEKHFRNHK